MILKDRLKMIVDVPCCIHLRWSCFYLGKIIHNTSYQVHRAQTDDISSPVGCCSWIHGCITLMADPFLEREGKFEWLKTEAMRWIKDCYLLLLPVGNRAKRLKFKNITVFLQRHISRVCMFLKPVAPGNFTVGFKLFFSIVHSTGSPTWNEVNL